MLLAKNDKTLCQWYKYACEVASSLSFALMSSEMFLFQTKHVAVWSYLTKFHLYYLCFCTKV
jgi:hypothetical protein